MLKLNNLSVHIGSVKVCGDLNLELGNGECLGILGLNGCGKTTLLHTLAGFLPAQSGEVRVGGKNVHKLNSRVRARKTACLLQIQEYNFPFSVFAVAAMATYAHNAKFELFARIDENKIHSALDRTGLISNKNQDVRSLSGGEKQRLALASLLLQDPDVYLLDEPTNNLDLCYIKLIKDIGRNINKINVMVLHNLQLVDEICTHILLLKSGDYRYGKVADILTKENLKWVYNTDLKEITVDNHRFFV